MYRQQRKRPRKAEREPERGHRRDHPRQKQQYDEEQATEVCHLCLGITVGSETKPFKGVTFHAGTCWDAVRAYRRLIGRVGKDALQNQDDMTIKDPENWRLEVAPMKALLKSRPRARKVQMGRS